MDNGKIRLAGVALLGALMLFGAGCSTFRAIFSRPAQSSKSTVMRPHRSTRSGVRTQRRDPVADLFAFDQRDNKDYMKNHDLTDRERELMQDSFAEDDLAHDYSRKVHYKYQENRLKTQEHVFGPNPFRK